MPVNSVTGIGSEWFLSGLATLQDREIATQEELSSGYRVRSAADAPSQVSELVELSSSLSTYQNWNTNLGSVQAEAQTADQAIGTATSLLQQAATLGSQGANSTATASSRQELAAQVQSIQQQLIQVANTKAGGRYIFAGDQDQTVPYQADSASVTGVDQLVSGTSTRTIVNPAGESVYVGLTAQQIFGPVDSSGNPSATNAFAALQSLATALSANDQAGITNAMSLLTTASDWVNQQQAYYGNAEQRIVAELTTAGNHLTTLQTEVGSIRDADVVQAATDLSQEKIADSAAYGAEAEISQTRNLFSYLA